MINLTKLNEFKSKISGMAGTGNMVENHKISTIKAHTVEYYENIISTVDENYAAIEEALLETMGKAINGALGKTDESKQKKAKR